MNSGSAKPLRRRTAGRNGFTLAEVMVASTVFLMVTLGVYACLIKSYQLAALSRTRDDARAVLRTFADQFQRLQTTERVGTATYNRWLFNPTGGPTGRGLVWGALSDENTSVNAEEVASLPVSLGSAENAVPATVTRDVRYVDPLDGEISATQQVQAAGYILMGTFTIEYTLTGKRHAHSLTVTRAVP